VDGGHDFRTKRTNKLVSLANSSALSFSFRDFYVWSKALSPKNRSLPGVITQYAQSSGLPAAESDTPTNFAMDPEGRRKNADVLM
jgi:hypothetical protein